MVQLKPLRPETAILTLARVAAQSSDRSDVPAPVGRHGLRRALLLAVGLVTMGYAMDWFLFGSVRLSRPDFFACIAYATLVPLLLAPCVSRWRNADRNDGG